MRLYCATMVEINLETDQTRYFAEHWLAESEHEVRNSVSEHIRNGDGYQTWISDVVHVESALRGDRESRGIAVTTEKED